MRELPRAGAIYREGGPLVPISSDSWADMITAGEITPAATDEDIRAIQPLKLDFNASEQLVRLRRDER